MLDFSLTIMGNDWLIIAFVAIVLFLGSKRLPEFSRTIGKVMGKYNKTKNLVQGEFQKTTGGYNLSIQGPVETERQKLEMIAKSLGIDFSNKTDNELRNLISSKVGKSNQNHGTENT